MDKNSLGSRDRLLLAAIQLISERGYNGVTTQEIAAAANLSEVTLFRHFGKKQKLLEEAFRRFHYAEEMRKLFNEHLVWELEEDLLMVCQTYHTIMNRNRKLIEISHKDEVHLPGFKDKLQEHPLQLLEFLTNYFIAMEKKGKVIKTDAKMSAFTFMMAQYGAFVNNLDTGINYPEMKLQPFIVDSVQIFARAMTP